MGSMAETFSFSTSDLHDKFKQIALLRPALILRYDPLVVECALYLYLADILPRDLIFRYCNRVDGCELVEHVALLEYDRFLIDRLCLDFDFF